MTRARGSEKPEKPRPDFPLTPHNSGQWCKKIHGKLRFFGPWDDPEGALSKYHRQRESLEHGAPAVDPDRITIRLLCRLFIETKEQQVDHGDLARRTLVDYQKTTERLIAFFGPSRGVAGLTAKDFERYRKAFPKAWSSQTVTNEIVRSSAVINYAWKEGLIDRPIQTGAGFRRPKQKKLRIERAESHAKFFEAGEIHAMLAHASDQMATMIMLGLNAAYGNADCARLTREMIDFDKQWLAAPRHKSGVWRATWLWPETIELLQKVLAKERTRVPAEYADLVFLTRYRKPWWVDGQSGDAISKEFTKLREAAGVYRERVGFYSLRHVASTIGEQTPGVSDPIAVRVILGHADQSIAEKYRERFDESKIRMVSEHIRDWWLAGKPKTKAKKSSPKKEN